MKQVLQGMGATALMVATQASVSLASAPSGDGPPDYSGISTMYYALIAIILGYGAYDIFFKKS